MILIDNPIYENKNSQFNVSVNSCKQSSRSEVLNAFMLQKSLLSEFLNILNIDEKQFFFNL